MGQSGWSSARVNTCRLRTNMAPCGKAVLLLLLVEGGLGARTLRGNRNAARDQRSLTNTFPFNAQDGEEHHAHGDHHGHHGEHHERQPVQSLEARAQRQGDDTDVSFPAVAAAGPGADGKRCIDKVEMVEETEYDDVVQCDHSYDRRCHTTYVTNYESQQEEDCEDETSGYTTNTKCSKWPREVCSVSKKPVKKYTPITGCTKEPRELCAPAGCGFVPGDEVCYDKVQTVVQDAPKEQCTLEPQRTCKHVTKLVPKLEPTEECVDVPKEVCTRSRTNPRKVKKPVVKKWCYVPTEESGLA